MDNMIAGVLRALTPAIVAWLVAKGWFTPEGASQLVQYFIDAIPLIIGIAAAISSVRSNMVKQQVVQIANSGTPDVKVVVGPAAPENIKEVAADQGQPNVVPVVRTP